MGLTAPFLFLAASLFVGPNESQASEPKAVITGPTNVGRGDLVILRADESQGSGHTWRAVTPGIEGRYDATEAGKKLYFAIGADGSYTFVVAVAKGDQADVAVHTVTVGAPVPPPTPPEPPSPPTPPTPPPTPPSPPVPPPPPTPPLSALASWAKEAGRELSAEERAKLAGVFREVARRATKPNAGEAPIRGGWAFGQETARLATAAIGQERYSPLADKLIAKLGELGFGRTTPLAQLAAAWVEIATGLEAAA